MEWLTSFLVVRMYLAPLRRGLFSTALPYYLLDADTALPYIF